MSLGIPMRNLGEPYVNGLKITSATDATITVAVGSARDSTNKSDITLASVITIDGGNNGAAGLDTGAFANNFAYAVYVIGNSMDASIQPGRGIVSTAAAASALFSLDLNEPLLPSGYDMFRRIGFVLTDGTADLLPFYQTGQGRDRWMHYDVSVATDITAGASAAFADVDCSDSVPSITTIIELDCTFTPTGANDELVIVPNGSTSTNGLNRMSGSAAGVVKIGHMKCPCEGDATLEYKVTGSAVALNVQGYLDVL